MLSLEQQHRRYVQQAAWTKPLREYLFSKLEPADSYCILDVGCGTGALVPDLLQHSPAVITGVDIHFPSLRFCQVKTNALQLLQADGLHLPFANNSFRLCLCHFLLLWVADPLQVLCEMRRVTCLGGYVFLLAEPDYGGRVDYPSPLEAVGTLQRQALQHQGADVFMGRKIKGLMRQAGFCTVESGVLGGQWTSQAYAEEFDLEWETFQHDVQKLFPSKELLHLREIAIQAEKNAERVLFIPTFYAAAQKTNL